MAEVVWRCQQCNYVHTLPAKPRKCPKCGAPYTRFLEIRVPSAQGKAEADEEKPKSEG